MSKNRQRQLQGSSMRSVKGNAPFNRIGKKVNVNGNTPTCSLFTSSNLPRGRARLWRAFQKCLLTVPCVDFWKLQETPKPPLEKSSEKYWNKIYTLHDITDITIWIGCVSIIYWMVYNKCCQHYMVFFFFWIKWIYTFSQVESGWLVVKRAWFLSGALLMKQK